MTHDRELEGMYKGEVLHSFVYSKFAEKEKNPKLKRILIGMSRVEDEHSRLWKRIIKGNPKHGARKTAALLFLYQVIRHVLGLSVAVKLIEYREDLFYKSVDRSKMSGYSASEVRTVRAIRSNEQRSESPLVNSLIGFNPILSNIRDVTFGMNDGLVEILAVTVGLGAALQTPLLVIIAGLIVAVSGALSMAGGAYLSTEYEKGVRILQKRSFKKPHKSAFYVGIAYILGSMVPLLPFMLGYIGALAIVLSMAMTAVVLSVVAFLIAVVTNESIKHRIAMTLAITIGIAIITILLGYFARTQFNLAI